MNKLILKIIKFLLKAVLYFFGFIVSIFIVLYISCPIYNFPDAKPFAGNKIHNPYANMDSSMWRKANFHAHTRNFGGITDGRLNTNKTVAGIYKYLSYDNYSISDYQKINQTNSQWNFYIPCYEHGFGIWKNHQLCIGANKVSWVDYPIFQTVHQQQNVINHLRADVDVIAIAHPYLRNSYNPSQFTKLTNYDLVEAVSNFCISEPHWDSALSVGQRVYVLASDDVHNAENTNEVGRKFNMINAHTSCREDIVTALKNGNSYAVDFKLVDKEDYYSKMKRAGKLPHLTNVEVVNDSLFIKISDSTAKFVFVGQGGNVLDSTVNSNIGIYKIKATDNYVRTRVYLPDGSVFYLNPVTRYDGDKPMANALATINYPLTWLLRIVGFGILFLLIYRCIIKKCKKKK